MPLFHLLPKRLHVQDLGRHLYLIPLGRVSEDQSLKKYTMEREIVEVLSYNTAQWNVYTSIIYGYDI
jgi:hypothetical protein